MYAPKTAQVQPLTDPQSAPSWTSSFSAWVISELRNVGAEFAAPKNATIFQPLYADPQRIFPCMVVYFASTAPSAASGEGLYRRNIANSAWVFVG